VELFAADVPAEGLLEMAWSEATADAKVMGEVTALVGKEDTHGRLKELCETITNMLLVLEFGWSGSPGHFGMFGGSAERATRRQAPQLQREDGSDPFHLATWVDDGVSVEPDLGRRAHRSIRAYERTVQGLLGKSSINKEKMEEEGETTTTCRAWGLDIDTEADCFTLPDVKWQKAQYILSQPIFDWGCKRVDRLELQILRGNGTFWKIVCPALRTELASIDRLLSGSQEPGFIRGHDEKDWIMFWLTVEVMRKLVALESYWRQTFTARSAQVLSPAERLSIPAERANTVWTGGDATLKYAGAVDWRHAWFYSSPVGDFLPALYALMGSEPEDVIIAVAELLTYLILTALDDAGEWDGRTVVYVSDNMNTVGWLNDRYSKVVLVQVILRLLALVEARKKFATISTYIRTYKNVVGDGLTREDREEVARDLELKGFTRKDPVPVWKHYLEVRVEGRSHRRDCGSAQCFAYRGGAGVRLAGPWDRGEGTQGVEHLGRYSLGNRLGSSSCPEAVHPVRGAESSEPCGDTREGDVFPGHARPWKGA
jgi:hypothetical protein